MLSLPRLYAILDVDVVASRGWAPGDVCRAWLSGGVALIQLRAKSAASGACLDIADQCAAMCREAGALFMVNDRADIAAMCGADGVHVGQDDLSPRDARLVIGQSAVVGMSTHDAAQLADALHEPVSYVAVGPVFPTRTKDTGHDAVGLEQVGRAVVAAHGAGVPLVAIGGITLERAGAVIRAGADAVAVISDLVATSDFGSLETMARRWVRELGDGGRGHGGSEPQ